jgi:hypothetical protein
MALEDIKDTECLCSWVSGLAAPVKAQLTTLFTSLKTVLQTAQIVYELVNKNWLDTLKKEGLEAALAIYQQAVSPIQAPLMLLTKYTSPFADCAPVAEIATVGKKIKSFVLQPIEDFGDKIQDLIDAIDEVNRKSDEIDRWLGIISDLEDAMNRC